MARDARDILHVGDGGADVLGGYVEPAERLDRAAEGAEQRCAVERAGGAAQHRLGAAEGQARERILVAHPLGQPQRICERAIDIVIVPQAATASARPERGRVNCDHAVEAGGGIEQADAFDRRGHTGGAADHHGAP